jgi:hypothetical protein
MCVLRHCTSEARERAPQSQLAFKAEVTAKFTNVASLEYSNREGSRNMINAPFWVPVGTLTSVIREAFRVLSQCPVLLVSYRPFLSQCPVLSVLLSSVSCGYLIEV